MSHTIPLHHRAAYALELARQLYGYLVIESEVTQTLRDAGLITTKDIGDGFVIARALKSRDLYLSRGVNGRYTSPIRSREIQPIGAGSAA